MKPGLLLTFDEKKGFKKGYFFQKIGYFCLIWKQEKKGFFSTSAENAMRENEQIRVLTFCCRR